MEEVSIHAVFKGIGKRTLNPSVASSNLAETTKHPVKK